MEVAQLYKHTDIVKYLEKLIAEREAQEQTVKMSAIPADVWRYKIAPFLSPLSAARLRGCNRFFYYAIPDTAGQYREKTVTGVMCIAAKKGHIDMVQLMIRKGANNWDWGLNHACAGGSIEVAKLMIQKGANNWMWALYWACEGGSIEAAKLMISSGANDWNFGLEGACAGGSIEAAKFMIQNGANNFHRSLHLARQWNHTDIAEYLEKLIAERDIVNATKTTTIK